MSNRKSNSSNNKTQDPNKQQLDNPLYNLILQNYERCHINSSMVQNINGFLFNLSQKLTPNNTQERMIKN